MTNFDHIKNMSVEEMARDFIFFVPNNKDFHYTGLSGMYFATSGETIENNIKYLESECDK